MYANSTMICFRRQNFRRQRFVRKYSTLYNNELITFTAINKWIIFAHWITTTCQYRSQTDVSQNIAFTMEFVLFQLPRNLRIWQLPFLKTANSEWNQPFLACFRHEKVTLLSAVNSEGNLYCRTCLNSKCSAVACDW